MHNQTKNLLFFSFIILLLLNGSTCFAAQHKAQPDPQQQLKIELEAAKQDLEQQNKNLAELKNELRLKEANATKAKSQHEETLKQAQQETENRVKETENRLNKNITDAQKEHQKNLNDILANHQAATEELKRQRVQVTQQVQYGFAGTMPDNVTAAQASIYNAQAEQLKYENSPKKLVVDAVTGTLKNIVCPLVVNGLTPKSEEFFKKRLGKTRHQEIQDEIAEDNKEISTLNKRLLQQQEQKAEQTSRHEEEMLKIQRRSALINQYASACHGINTRECVEMGNMIDAMLKADLARCYKESTGKDYVEPSQNSTK